MKKYLDPKADLTFKKIFGEHEELLISLLNALLPLKEDELVEEVEFLSYGLGVVNARCKDVKGVLSCSPYKYIGPRVCCN